VVGTPLGHEPQHLQIPRGEPVDRVVVAADQELRDDLRVQGGAAGRYPAHRVQEVTHVRDAVLQQVANGALRRGQQVGGVAPLDALGQDQQCDVRVLAADDQRGPDAFVGVRGRHPNIDDGQVWLVLSHRPEQLLGVRHGRGDLEAAVGEHPSRPARWAIDGQRAVHRGGPLREAPQPGAGPSAVTVGWNGAAGSVVGDGYPEHVTVARGSPRPGSSVRAWPCW
jgi:hypothetical protein